jgi:hypothetical protein
MIDLFIGLRFNRNAVIIGPALSGKSTITNTILGVINEFLQSTENLNIVVSLNVTGI